MIQADKGLRVGNFIADTIVLSVIVLALTYIMYVYFPGTAERSSPAFDILFSVVFFCYYFLFELFFGKTIGKMLTKTIVVDQNGNKPRALRLIIRTLLRMIPVEGLSFLFGNYGLHDLLSKTTVVKIESLHTNRV